MLIKSSLSPLKRFDKFRQLFFGLLLFDKKHALIDLDGSCLSDELVDLGPLSPFGDSIDTILDSTGLRVLFDNAVELSPIRLGEELH
jgi:hypothetical protein